MADVDLLPGPKGPQGRQKLKSGPLQAGQTGQIKKLWRYSSHLWRFDPLQDSSHKGTDHDLGIGGTPSFLSLSRSSLKLCIDSFPARNSVFRRHSVAGIVLRSPDLNLIQLFGGFVAISGPDDQPVSEEQICKFFGLVDQPGQAGSCVQHNEPFRKRRPQTRSQIAMLQKLVHRGQTDSVVASWAFCRLVAESSIMSSTDLSNCDTGRGL